MNALLKTKCTRITLILGLCLIVAGPAMLLWASRATLREQSDAALDALEAAKIAQNGLPAATNRPAEYAVFGEAFNNGAIRVQGEAKGHLRMNIGDMDIKNPDALLNKVPAELRLSENEKTSLGSKGSLRQGLNYAMLRQESIASKGLEAVLAELSSSAKIVGIGSNSTFLIYAEAGQIGRLRQNPDVAFFQAVPPADKIGLETGKRPLIEKARALDANFLLEVTLVPGTEAAGKQAIEKVPGVVSVAEAGPQGSSLLVRADYRSLSKLAKIDQVFSVQERFENMTFNARTPSELQAGAAQETNQARPFDDYGVDGGGIDTNADGQRINNGSDTVPPQLVGVLDNGVSPDTANWSQTGTTVFDAGHPVIGPTHRKDHAIINTSGDGGNDCDSVLHGGGSHGNTVAAVIAAYPSALGVFAMRQGIGGSGQGFRGANLDGVARGARIIVNDIGDASQCTINSLVERGGNVSPGNMATRLAELICPSSGGTGLCTGIVGGNGGTQIHLAVTPFGAPDNFSTQQFQLSDGTYPQQSVDIDKFLFNNRDFLIFGPAGNSGVLISSSRASFWTPRVIPDYFDGTDVNNCPVPCPPSDPKKPIQIPPPMTAKNIVTVGITRSDEFTQFAQFDNLANMATFSS